MKEKMVVTTVLTMLLIGTILTIIPTLATPDSIKIGIVGPYNLPHWSPAGMKEGAEIAAQEINDAGGVNVGGTYYDIELVFKDEHSYPPPEDVPAAQQSIQDLYDDGVRIIIGGFRTEVTGPMIETAMTQAEPVIFMINGASTDSLISETVPVDYAKYKYLFRINPMNDTMLVGTILGGLQGLIAKMLPLFGCYNPDLDRTQIKYAVLTEDKTWTLTLHTILSNPAYYPHYVGPYMNCTYAVRIDPAATSTLTELNEVIESGARIMIHVFSAPVGAVLIAQWAALGVQAMPVGINVVGQLQTHWASTLEGCEYEAILCAVGTATPITSQAVTFWNDFTAKTGGVWPIYTAFGAYNGLYAIKDAIEAAGTTDADAVVSALESQERLGLNGLSKFASNHDLFCNSTGLDWPQPQYTRAMVVQWQAGRMEVVSPMDQLYSKKWAIAPWIYPLTTDLDYNGKVNILDIAKVAASFGSSPGHPRWDIETDVDGNDTINILDVAKLAADFGKEVSLPIGCD